MDRFLDLGLLRRIPAYSTAPGAVPLPTGACGASGAAGAALMVEAKAAEMAEEAEEAVKRAAKKLS